MHLFHRRNALSQNLARAVGVNVVVLVFSFLLDFALGLSKKSNLLDVLSSNKVCIFEI